MFVKIIHLRKTHSWTDIITLVCDYLPFVSFIFLMKNPLFTVYITRRSIVGMNLNRDNSSFDICETTFCLYKCGALLSRIRIQRFVQNIHHQNDFFVLNWTNHSCFFPYIITMIAGCIYQGLKINSDFKSWLLTDDCLFSTL